MVSVNVTFSMTPEMLEDVDDTADDLGMSRAEYLRHLVRQAPDSSFECPESLFEQNADIENQEGAA